MDYLLEDPMSRKRVRRVARYLFDGLGMKNRAIAVLETGRTNKVLDDKGQTQLLSWLLDQERYGQALPLLESMVHAQPDALQLRTLQMTTHARAGDLDAARSLFQETVRSLEVQQRWNEENSLAMAKAAMELGLHVQAIVQQRKAIEHHLRTVGRKEQGDERLSFHLSTLAESYLAQGAFALAVKMSARAVLAWGDNVFRRKRREKDVTALLRNIKDLPSWWHEEKAGFDAETGIIQKSIALLLIERNETRKALDMLRQARQRNPRDIEIHERLLRASQQAKDLTSSCEALLSWIKVEPKQLTLYTQLGSELESMGDYQAAERAYSSTVELEPEQREGHEIIAKRREQQKRFDDAAVQWQRILRIDSRLPDAWLSLARVQIRSGAKAKAKKTLEHLLSLRWEKQHGAVKLKARLLLDLLDTEEPR